VGGRVEEGSFLRTCLLVSVWPDYRWLVPVLEEMLKEFWPGHPEIVFSGTVDDGRNWTRNLFSGVLAAREKGFDSVYLINEEHVPVGPCHLEYLMSVLPAQAGRLGAAYVSLFGWDNKRFCSKSPVLGLDDGMWMHFTGERDPRFHLHPAWWRLDALEACCRLVLDDGRCNGSAWHFEKTCDDLDADLPEKFRMGCYQIHAGVTGVRPLGFFGRVSRLAKRWVDNKAMAVVPFLRPGVVRKAWLKFWNFDSVVSDGAYPMVFSGVLAKGRLNPVFVEHCRRTLPMEKWLSRIEDLREAQPR
jgi:hypothetical protein